MAAYKSIRTFQSKSAFTRMLSSSSKEINKIAVIGSGLMGSGIAQVSIIPIIYSDIYVGSDSHISGFIMQASTALAGESIDTINHITPHNTVVYSIYGESNHGS